jgi:cell division ATPase FtsA
MGFFSKSKKKNELVLLFDIGSSSVGGALVLIQESGAPRIVYATRETVLLEKELNINSFLNSTLKSLDLVVAKICKQGLGKPERVFCVLSSPWFHSETRDIKLEKNIPFVFNTKLADTLTQKEVGVLMEEFASNHVDSIGKIVPIEMKTMSVNLNGYEVLDPQGKKAQSLEMSIFVSMSEEDFIKKIEEIIGKHFHVDSIKFSSFLMASFVVARDMFINQDKFLLINIGGEVTDISMIKKNTVKDSVSFPVGCNFITRGLTKALDIHLDEARSFLQAYKDNHISDSANKKLNDSIQVLKHDWLKIFQESLNNLSHDISIPSTIFITVDQNLAPFFSEIIKEEQLNQYSLTDSKFRIIFLGTEALHGIALFENEKIMRDSLLLIESIYINHFLK